MTGFDCLKEELRSKGFTKQQLENSKLLPAVLDIIAQSGDKYTSMANLEKDIKEINDRISSMKLTIRCLETEENVVQKRISEARNEYEKYIDEFYKTIWNCETPEGRDRLKAAQMYVNTAKVNTAYDQTAFNIALGAILSGGRIAPMQELKKINKGLPWEVP
jgi:chromosome segregation ATPase